MGKFWNWLKDVVRAVLPIWKQVDEAQDEVLKKAEEFVKD